MINLRKKIPILVTTDSRQAFDMLTESTNQIYRFCLTFAEYSTWKDNLKSPPLNEYYSTMFSIQRSWLSFNKQQ